MPIGGRAVVVVVGLMIPVIGLMLYEVVTEVTPDRVLRSNAPRET